VAALRFSRRAEADLLSIGNYTVRTWGKAQAARYVGELEVCCQTLSDNPALGRVCDGRRGDYRCGRLRKNGQLLGLFFERVSVGFFSWPRFGNFNIMHWVYVFLHALAKRVTERAAQKVFDVA
jgi:plasmid stabilization system protein ParE